MNFWKQIWEKIKELFNSTPDHTVTTTTSTDSTPSGDLDLTKVKWLGENYSSITVVENILNSASMNNNSISTNYNAYSWPSKIVKVEVDAVCCIFYERGSDIVGGKFDWWRKGGQIVKGLENIHNGYNGHTIPSSGAKVWTCIVSIDGKKRSNVISVKR